MEQDMYTFKAVKLMRVTVNVHVTCESLIAIATQIHAISELKKIMVKLFMRARLPFVR